ncbi:RNA methyltransferase [Gleimia hominis]|uniref:RNA methyltransferase n=1 Tax=Gleimia hominis TaxID=595468 RepID=A0ABU3IBK5_9ACTO|nr:RNA methyltransferase [Gleimia hominis]MDT3767760.1 RNA methyltransferase [Gleimia hominis]
MIVELDDLTDERLRDYRGLTDVALRRVLEPRGGLFIAESKNVIERALEGGYEPRSFLTSPRWLDGMRTVFARFPDAPVFVAEESVLEQLTGFHVHRGVLASMHRHPLPAVEALLQDARRVVVLEDIVDHTNVGAIFRSAAALNVDAVLVTPSCADPLYRRSVRVSMGTVFQVPWTRLDAWPDPHMFQSHGFETVALALHDKPVSLQDFAHNLEGSPGRRIAWIMGSEGYGIKNRTLRTVDHKVMIPMSHGVDSLNVAAAAAVVFWATRPQ